MLKSWSPMQNLAKLRAPLKPTLVVTAALDERVDPEQAYAITDALQNRFGAKAPVFLWVEPNAGHFAATEVAELSFIAKEFRVKALSADSVTAGGRLLRLDLDLLLKEIDRGLSNLRRVVVGVARDTERADNR